MSTTHQQPRTRSVISSGRTFAGLGALAAALVVAIVVGPGPLAARGSAGDLADQHTLVEALRGGFLEYWSSGDRELPPDLARVVDYWFRYHLAKALIAALLLIVLVVLGIRLWKAFLRADDIGAGRRVALASTGILVTVLALLSLMMVMANVQGVAAPFSSLLPMLAPGTADGKLGGAIVQVRQRLAESPSASSSTLPALEVMISDFARYHAAMAVIAAIVAAALLVLSFLLWKWFARTMASDRRARRVSGSFGLLAALFSLAAVVLVMANAATAADSAPALLAFFEGGW